MNILIIGAGKLGFPLAHQLNKLGHKITTLSKSPKQVENGITHICQDVHLLSENSFENYQFDWVYVILTPQERSELGYTKAYVNSIYPIANSLKNQPIKRLIYVSSTQVFGNNFANGGGQEIDDDTLPIPSTDFGKILYAAELLYQAFFKEKLTIIRPSGLIGDDSNFLMKLAENLSKITENHWLNLIKRDDVITILTNLPDYANKLTADNKNLLPSYIVNECSMIRHELLNRIRKNNNLPIIEVPDNLPTTGKKLIAKRLSHLLESQNLKLSKVNDF